MGELQIVTIMPFNCTLFNSLIGAGGCEYNYMGLGFDPIDKCYFILCQCL